MEENNELSQRLKRELQEIEILKEKARMRSKMSYDLWTDDLKEELKLDLIKQFQITVDGKKLLINTDEVRADRIREALVWEDNFIWYDIQRDYSKFPRVITTLFFKEAANIDTFLSIPAIKGILLNNIEFEKR